jgi:hypothetical protein
MRPTTWGTLVLLVVFGAGLGFGVTQVLTEWAGSAPSVPVGAPITLACVAGLFVVADIVLRPRLRREPGTRPLHPLTAARVAMLAKAGCIGGAVVTGMYLGLIGYLLLGLTNDYRRHIMVVAGISAVCAGLATVAAYVLERACRVEPPTDPGPVGGAKDPHDEGLAPSA